MTPLEALEARTGHRYTAADYETVRTRAAEHPERVSDDDLLVLAHFGGVLEADRVRAARAEHSNTAKLAKVITEGIRAGLAPHLATIGGLQQQATNLEQRVLALEAALAAQKTDGV